MIALRFFRLVSIIHVLALVLAFGVSAKDELPPPMHETSALKSVEEDIEAILVNWPISDSKNSKVKFVADLAEVVAQSYRDFADGRGRFEKWKAIPNSKKVLMICRYNLGDERVRDAILYAKKMGIGKIQIVSDGNIYYQDGVFDADQKYSAAFSKATLVDSMSGKVLSSLKEAGFAVNKAENHSISLAPLGNKELLKIIDIYHTKHDIFGICKDAECLELEDGLWQDGSHNAVTDKDGNSNPRINMVVLRNDPLGAKYSYRRAIAMINNFRKGGTIGDVEYENPLQINYTNPSLPEGDPKRNTHQVIAFTDGQVNPNIMSARLMYRAAGLDENGDPLTGAELELAKKLKVKKVGLYHFVTTYNRGFSALEALLKAATASNSKLDVNLGVDGQFAYVRGFGQIERLFGFPDVPPMGMMKFPFSKKILKNPDGSDRVSGYIYQAPSPFAPDRDPDGRPDGRKVFHLKLTILETEENGQNWVDVFVGSLNLSNHEENAEVLTWFRLPAESPVATELLSAVQEIGNTEPQFRIHPDLGIVREIFRNFVGRSVFDIPLPWVKEQLDLAKAGNFAAIGDNVRKLIALPTEVTKPDTAEQVEKRISRMIKFRTWYGNKDYFREIMSPERLGILAVFILAVEEEPVQSFTLKRLLNFLLWTPGVDEAQMEARLRSAWDELNLPGKFLERKPAKEGDAKKAEVAAVTNQPSAGVGGAVQRERHVNAPPPLEERRSMARAVVDSQLGRTTSFAPLACDHVIKAL